jgi:AAA+ ATPase superfamily predicted ATPase
MKNPFIYSGIVEGESFCNRKKELKDLVTFSETSQNVMIFSHRRFGKTSLIKKLIKELGKSKPPIKTFYIDLYGTLTEKDFITCVLRSFSQVESKIEKLAAILKKLFTYTRPKISFDPESGKIDITPSYDPEDRPLVFNEALESLAKYSEKSKAVVVFDEFQEIAAYNDKTIEKRLRKVIQFHNHISYIFMGSQRHILDQMLWL